MNILVTGGSGFRGSALIRHIINETGHEVINLDKLTYAANLESHSDLVRNKFYKFKNLDICNENELTNVIK